MQLLFFLLQTTIYIFLSKKQFLSRSFNSTGTIEAPFKRKQSTETETGFKRVLLEHPQNQFYFLLANVVVSSKEPNKPKQTFITLSIHNISSDDKKCFKSKIIVFRGMLLWSLFLGEYKEYIEAGWCSLYNTGNTLLNLDKGFSKIRMFDKLKPRVYVEGSISFRTREFVEWLRKNKHIFDLEAFSTEWRPWRKNTLTNWKIYVRNENYKLRVGIFNPRTDSTFCINQNINVIKAYNKNLTSRILDKICVRIDEDSFNDFARFIASYDEEEE